MKRLTIALVLLVVPVVPAGAASQTTTDRWSFELSPYIWLPTIDGKLNYDIPGSGDTLEVDPRPHDHRSGDARSRAGSPRAAGRGAVALDRLRGAGPANRWRRRPRTSVRARWRSTRSACRTSSPAMAGAIRNGRRVAGTIWGLVTESGGDAGVGGVVVRARVVDRSRASRKPQDVGPSPPPVADLDEYGARRSRVTRRVAPTPTRSSPMRPAPTVSRDCRTPRGGSRRSSATTWSRARAQALSKSRSAPSSTSRPSP